jgi:hypothetical protein
MYGLIKNNMDKTKVLMETCQFARLKAKETRCFTFYNSICKFKNELHII